MILFRGFNYKVLTDLSTNLVFRYIGEQYTNSSNTEKTDDYTLVDLGLNYDLNKKTTLYSGVDNIFDKEVEEELGANVGAYYFAGVKVNF